MYIVSEIEGLQVVGAKDKVLGRVTHVLFHPSEPRVVGIEVQPPALAYVVERRPRYLPLDTLVLSKEAVAVLKDMRDELRKQNGQAPPHAPPAPMPGAPAVPFR